MNVVELRTREELRTAWPVMRELRGHLTEDQWLQLTETMAADGYRLLALQDGDGAILAAAGIRLATNLYYGRHVWVYELVTAGGARSRGHGQALLGHVEEIAAAEGCEMVALSSGLQRVDAHRFYEERMGYDKVSYTFTKRVGPGDASMYGTGR
ncbi:MAG TPA: GNAT family N-acetyltransferase [Actinomycetota bacterium]|nr:GNAT family N-acetyltransferase [Actinomycetota bacterium]